MAKKRADSDASGSEASADEGVQLLAALGDDFAGIVEKARTEQPPLRAREER